MMALLEWLGKCWYDDVINRSDVISWDELVTVAREHLRLVSIACGECKFGVPEAHACIPLIVQ
jgi:hypothetical protein